MAVTIKDVAALAGVSPSTVSFSLLMLSPASQSILSIILSRMHIHIIYATVCVNYTSILHEVQCVFVFSTFLTIFTS